MEYLKAEIVEGNLVVMCKGHDAVNNRVLYRVYLNRTQYVHHKVANTREEAERIFKEKVLYLREDK